MKVNVYADSPSSSWEMSLKKYASRAGIFFFIPSTKLLEIQCKKKVKVLNLRSAMRIQPAITFHGIG